MEEFLFGLSVIGCIWGATMVILLILQRPGKKPDRTEQGSTDWPAVFSRSVPMSGRHVGWIRTHWRHWEPIIWGNELSDVWEKLRDHQSADEDGERVVLPYGERPVNLYSPDAPQS
jgi:hypothetical protein